MQQITGTFKREISGRSFCQSDRENLINCICINRLDCGSVPGGKSQSNNALIPSRVDAAKRQQVSNQSSKTDIQTKRSP